MQNLSINENNNKIYVGVSLKGAQGSFGLNDFFNVIYTLNNVGVIIDSVVWGTNTKYDNSRKMEIRSFAIDSNYLKVCINELSLNTFIFGNDTIITPKIMDMLKE